MTKNAGKGGKRKSPMEGFNNVPKILEEARRMVDVVTAIRACRIGENTKPDKQVANLPPPEPKPNPKSLRPKRLLHRQAGSP